MGDPKDTPKPKWHAVGAITKNCAVIRFEHEQWTETGPDEHDCYTYEAKKDDAQFSAQAVGERAPEVLRGKKGSKVRVCGSVLHMPDGFEEL